MTATQKSLDKLEQHTDKKTHENQQMQRGKPLHLRHSSAMLQDRLGTDHLESSSAEKGLG